MRKKISNAAHAVYYGIHNQKSLSRNQIENCYYQRWSRGHKARGQGQGHKKNPRPRPRTAFPRTDTLEAKDRNARGQGQGPRTQAQVLSKKKKKRSSQKFFRRSQKKKKVFTKIFQAISTKTRFPKTFSSAPQNFNNSKKYCCPRAQDRPIFEDLRPRGQGQGLDLRGQGQGLQNVSSRTSSRPRTSSRTPPLAITVCVRLKKSIFLYATISRIVSVTDIIHRQV